MTKFQTMIQEPPGLDILDFEIGVCLAMKYMKYNFRVEFVEFGILLVGLQSYAPNRDQIKLPYRM